MCGEDGSEGTSDSSLVEYYLENDQADDTCPKDQPLSVQGRLREHSSFWERDLEDSQFVLDIITGGYKLPFITYPQPMIAKNHRSTVSLLKPGMSLIFGSTTSFSLMGMLFGSPYSVTMVAYSDASGTGCGGYVVELGPVCSVYMCVPMRNVDLWAQYVCSYEECGLVGPVCVFL